MLLEREPWTQDSVVTGFRPDRREELDANPRGGIGEASALVLVTGPPSHLYDARRGEQTGTTITQRTRVASTVRLTHGAAMHEEHHVIG